MEELPVSCVAGSPASPLAPSAAPSSAAPQSPTLAPVSGSSNAYVPRGCDLSILYGSNHLGWNFSELSLRTRTHVPTLRLDSLTSESCILFDWIAQFRSNSLAFARVWLISFNLGSTSATVASATATAAFVTAVPAAFATAVPAVSATAASATAPSPTFSEASSGMRGCNPYNR
ncbi:hypothetical protein, variant 4 [Blastomyces dermatitidis ATCC 26199]|nr:hypothetical protein, variant 1 [Blastomyces dermatitidis ATCC 26199]EQL28177.1 hypothetical protein, variant 2 [Blastomyces dermatitidis ATCC 26199]EQL28178.1 hypothetical protein, variant 3 [Blastomyces dermatitidis ATCC 26199]EQL28179.1 hypothetical protein, variant 4 [Blastomyces dermatitidis ATCC 26199]